MSDTAPGAISTAEARKIAEQFALLEKVKDDSAYRTEVLLQLREQTIMLAYLKELLHDHIKSDEGKFKGITQSIDENKGIINKIVGGFIFVAAIGGLIAAIGKVVDMVRGST